MGGWKRSSSLLFFPMEAPKPQNASDSKLHFLDYWRIIRIRKTVILAVFLLVVLTTTTVTFMLPESFSSTARIEVRKDTTDIAPLLMGTQSEPGFDPYFIQTEFEKIKSRAVLYQVIEDADPNLDLIKKFSKRLGADSYLSKSEIYPYLLKAIDLRQSRNTSLIEIRVFDEDPKLASVLANKIADHYKSNRWQNSRGASDESIAFLESQLKLQSNQVWDAQNEVDQLRKKFKIADIDAGGLVSTLEPQVIRMIEQDRISAISLQVRYETLLEKLKGLSKSQLRTTLPSTQPDSQLLELLSKLAATENEIALRLNEAGPENAGLIRLSNLLSNLNTQIDARADGILTGLVAQAAVQTATIKALEEEVENAKIDEAEKTELYRPYFLAKQNMVTQQRVYETINLRIVQERIDAGLPKAAIVQVIDEAEPGVRPVRPNVPLNIALGVVVGLLMGFGLAFFIEYLDTSVKTIDDVERALQAPVMGVIPQNVGALIDEGPESPHAEAYRVLRTNILFSRKDAKWNTLTVVSGGAGEGKSTTIFNLATVFAQQGQRILIVDSDLRRPSLHKLLGVSNSLGLTNFLLKQNSLEEVVQTTKVPMLHFLPSGKLPSSSLGILSSTQMKDFVKDVKERYDFVFFDSPPIMGVSDASVLASAVDMALLVIQYRKYPQAMTIRAKQMVEKVGGNLLGVVLNNINISQDSYYYYYSGYYYDYYSKHDEDSAPKNNGESAASRSDRGGVEIKKKY